MTTEGCQTVGVTEREQTIARIRAGRNEALHHARRARELAAARRDLIQSLIDDGLSQAAVARELGVTRQAIQKMLAC